MQINVRHAILVLEMDEWTEEAEVESDFKRILTQHFHLSLEFQHKRAVLIFVPFIGINRIIAFPFFPPLTKISSF